MRTDNRKTKDLTAEVIPIGSLFKDWRVYYIRRQRDLRASLDALPGRGRGSVVKKWIKGHPYYYLVYRTGTKVKFDYLGKTEPVELRKQIQMRRWIVNQLRKVRAALYALGVAKRSQATGLSKRFAVFERDGFSCQYCGRNPREHGVVLVVDHVAPAKRGGESSLDNLITACVECNSGKRARLLEKLV